MTRVAIIADSHFDESSRFDECVRIHDWIADDLERRSDDPGAVDLVLHSGDVFERKSTPRERAAVADWLRHVAEIAPVVIVRGNHDAVGDLSIFAKLRTRFPIIVEEAAGVHIVAGVAVGCLAWPRKAEILAAAPDLDPSEALRHLLRGLGMQMAEHAGPRVLLSHAMVSGSRTSLGQPLVGCDFELGLEDLALAGADLVALGHIHMPQSWGGDTDLTRACAPIIYPGSPRRTAFGETEEKGYVLADLDESTPARVLAIQRIATPCSPMLLLEARFDPTTGGLSRRVEVAAEDVDGAEIRYRYEVDADHRAAARARAEEMEAAFLEEGAFHVKLEEVVIATSSARAPDVARAVTLDAKLRAMWAARGEQPDPERAERLLSYVHELEAA